MFLHFVLTTKTTQTCPLTLTLTLTLTLLPPGLDVSPSQGYPPAVSRQYPFIHLGEERQGGVKFCLTKQRDGQGLNPGPPDLEFEVLTALPQLPSALSLIFFFTKHV